MARQEYVVYKGDNFITLGTCKECCTFLEINTKTFYTYYNRTLHQKKYKPTYEIYKIED